MNLTLLNIQKKDKMKDMIVNIILIKELNFPGQIAYIYFIQIIVCFILKFLIFAIKDQIKKLIMIFQIKYINKGKEDF